jgi:hypothetical protein
MGGFIGDWAEQVHPKVGRTAIGQFSVFAGIPLSLFSTLLCEVIASHLC